MNGGIGTTSSRAPIPGFLYQQNTLRDALTAAVNLDLFQAHADRVSMANIAQMINVLQAMILTDKEKMVLTPTYHVFEMYKVHQGATLIPLEIKSPDYELESKSVPAVHATASQDKDGKIHISLVNLDANHPAQISANVPSGSAVLAARILTADTLSAHNTFDKPDAVKPAKFDHAKIDGDKLVADLPSKSIVVIELQKAGDRCWISRQRNAVPQRARVVIARSGPIWRSSPRRRRRSFPRTRRSTPSMMASILETARSSTTAIGRAAARNGFSTRGPSRSAPTRSTSFGTSTAASCVCQNRVDCVISTAISLSTCPMPMGWGSIAV